MYIDPDLVTNRENFKLIEQNVICPICSGVLISPIQCLGCENCFCQLCIEDWKKRQGENSCPFRCNNPSFKNSRMIKNILSNLKFKCKNGCNEEIPYLELENHYNEKCRNNKIDYKQKFFEYKNKYLELLNKNMELENQLKQYKNQNKNNIYLSNDFKSKYHSHILYDQTNMDNDWICKICSKDYESKTEKRFRCDSCDFDICLRCKILEESGYIFQDIFISKNHQHLLKKNLNTELFGWKCDICKAHFMKKKDTKEVKRFRCQDCNFDICGNCKNNEENEIK